VILAEKLIDYLDGILSEEEQLEVEKELNDNPELRDKLEQMRQLNALMIEDATLQDENDLDWNIQHLLVQETHQPKVVSLFSRFRKEWAVAASFLAIVGLLTGILISNNNQHKQAMALMQEQMKENQQLMFSLLEGESASGRIKAVNLTTAHPQQADIETFMTLSRVLNNDENLNVRLATIDALKQFSDQEEVRTILIEALESQTEPITKIALIHALVELKEKRVVPQLQNLINHPMLEKPVKDEAYNGLLQMGEPI